MRRIAEREVVTVVPIVRDDSPGVDGCRGEEHLVLVRTAGHRDGIGRHVSCLEELGGRVAGAGGIGQPFAPAVDRRTRWLAVAARAVPVLELGQHERLHEIGVVREGGRELPGLAFLGRNHDGAIGCGRTVEGCGRSAGEHRHGFDVFGVQVGDRLRGAARAEFRVAASAGVVHRDAVDDVKCVRGLQNRLVAAHDDLRGAADTRRRGVDRDAGHLARKRVDEVGVLGCGQGCGVDLLDVVAEGLLLALDAEGRDHDLVDLRGRLPERDGDPGASAHGHDHRFVAQVVDLQLPVGGRSRHGERKGSESIRADADRRAFDNDRGPDDRLAFGVADDAPHLREPGFGPVGQNDVRAADLVDDRRPLHHLVEGRFQRLIVRMDRDGTVRIHIVLTGEKIFRLFLYLLHDRLHPHMFPMDRYAYRLRNEPCRGPAYGDEE